MTIENSQGHGSGVTEQIPDYDPYRQSAFRFAHIGKSTPSLTPTQLEAIAKSMRAEPQNVGAIATKDNDKIAAGFTYFGQFLAHDITISRHSGDESPALRLQSLYGHGPGAMPYLYAYYGTDFNDPAMRSLHHEESANYPIFRGVKLYVESVGGDQYDIRRLYTSQVPLMADTRNDQNFLLLQLHCAFIRFHNAVADWLNFKRPALTGEALFSETRKLVTWCYHRIIVEEYLKPLMYEGALVDRLANPDHFLLFKPDEEPRMMPEFSRAALRIGHSQVQDVYTLNRAKERRRIFGRQSARNNNLREKDLRGFTKYPFINFEWPLFFDMPEQPLAQPSSAIDHTIADPLNALIFLKNRPALAQINLARSEALPTGHAFASVLYPLVNEKTGAYHTLLTDDEVRLALGVEVKAHALPLWLYILLEAEVKYGGQNLGVLGSHIVAEQIMWVLAHEPYSYLKHETPLVQKNNKDIQIDHDGLSAKFKHITMAGLIQFPKEMRRDIQQDFNQRIFHAGGRGTTGQ
ncbi:MAG: hypothetical protein KIS77_01800 [Saprospiraceae bacterium]|nr:hypothetical protein [Saprospiraceae bacterium]